jgi:hypothetical protein
MTACARGAMTFGEETKKDLAADIREIVRKLFLRAEEMDSLERLSMSDVYMLVFILNEVKTYWTPPPWVKPVGETTEAA